MNSLIWKKFITVSPDGTYSKGVEEGIQSGTKNLDEFVGIDKSVKQDVASGGIARMLGE